MREPAGTPADVNPGTRTGTGRGSASPPATLTSRDWTSASLVFSLLLGLYLLNGDFLPILDASFNTYQPVLLLTRGRVATTPTDTPCFFLWYLETPEDRREVAFARWDQKFQETNFAQLRERGRLYVARPRYCVFRSVQKDEHTGEMLYVDTFGVGAGLTALPVFA